MKVRVKAPKLKLRAKMNQFPNLQNLPRVEGQKKKKKNK